MIKSFAKARYFIKGLINQTFIFNIKIVCSLNHINSSTARHNIIFYKIKILAEENIFYINHVLEFVRPNSKHAHINSHILYFLFGSFLILHLLLLRFIAPAAGSCRVIFRVVVVVVATSIKAHPRKLLCLNGACVSAHAIQARAYIFTLRAVASQNF